MKRVVRGEYVKILMLAGATLLAFITLATSFPLVIASGSQGGGQALVETRSSNMEDHLAFTRELAEQGTRLDVLAQQHAAMINLPERMARVEERLDNLVRMAYALLGGVFALLLKELWSSMQSIRSRKAYAGVAAGEDDRL